VVERGLASDTTGIRIFYTQHPERMPDAKAFVRPFRFRFWHPAGMLFRFYPFPVVSVAARLQPPAKVWQASGLRSGRRVAALRNQKNSGIGQFVTHHPAAPSLEHFQFNWSHILRSTRSKKSVTQYVTRHQRHA
jgi:hypothetical protein